MSRGRFIFGRKKKHRAFTHLRIVVSSVRYHVVAFRLLPGQPRFEDFARAHAGTHEKRICRGPVSGETCPRRASLASRFAVTPPTQGGHSSVQRFQRHGVVLHQRRFKRSHQVLTSFESILLGRESWRV